MNRAVIFDRDGTINIDRGYVHKIEDFEFRPNVIEAIKKLNDNGYKVIIITNQSGIGRGYYTKEDVEKLHNFINYELLKYGAHIDDFYYCPHKPKDNCLCRKPGIILHIKAIQEHNINIDDLTLIGDKKTDIEPAKYLGCKKYLIDPKINLRTIIDNIIGEKSEY